MLSLSWGNSFRSNPSAKCSNRAECWSGDCLSCRRPRESACSQMSSYGWSTAYSSAVLFIFERPLIFIRRASS
jgi:hypothetical protein